MCPVSLCRGLSSRFAFRLRIIYLYIKNYILGIWVHVEGKSTPQFDSNGYVVAPDSTGTFISDLERFLDIAAENNVFV